MIGPIPDRWRGPAFMLGASLGFAAMGVLVKRVSTAIPTGEIVAWRSAVMAVVVTAAAVRSGVSLRPSNLPMLVVRGLIGTGSMWFYFHAIARLPVGDAVLLTYLSPLIVAGLAPYTVGESASPRVWGALGIGLVGVGFVVGPAWSTDHVGLLFALIAAWFAAGAYLSVKVLTRTDPPLSIVWWFSVIGTLAASGSWLDGVTRATTAQWAALGVIGLLGAVAQWCLTRAYAASPAAQVSVYAYATPVFAYGLGLFTGEVPSWTSVVGAALVVVAGWIASTG
ncbi:MAG: DMT family transporter [Myxococcota bacterium]